MRVMGAGQRPTGSLWNLPASGTAGIWIHLMDVLVPGVNRTPKGQADPQDGNDDGDGVRIHDAYLITQ